MHVGSQNGLLFLQILRRRDLVTTKHAIFDVAMWPSWQVVWDDGEMVFVVDETKPIMIEMRISDGEEIKPRFGVIKKYGKLNC